MEQRVAVKKIEHLLGVEKVRPKLKKYETEISTTLESIAFENPEMFKLYCPDDTELEVTVTGRAVKATHGTYEDPPEGGYSEDVFVWVGGDDITEYLKEEALDVCADKHYDEVSQRD